MVSKPTQKTTSYSLIALVILIASFTQWFSLYVDAGVESLQVSAWNSSINIYLLSIPNWLLVFVAFGIPLIIGLKSFNFWEPPKALPIALSIYGVVHSFVAILLSLGQSSLGVGPILSFAGFIAFCILMHRDPEIQLGIDQSFRKLILYFLLFCVVLIALPYPGWMILFPLLAFGIVVSMGLRFFFTLRFSQWVPIILSLAGVVGSAIGIATSILLFYMGEGSLEYIRIFIVLCAFIAFRVRISKDW